MRDEWRVFNDELIKEALWTAIVRKHIQTPFRIKIIVHPWHAFRTLALDGDELLPSDSGCYDPEEGVAFYNSGTYRTAWFTYVEMWEKWNPEFWGGINREMKLEILWILSNFILANSLFTFNSASPHNRVLRTNCTCINVMFNGYFWVDLYYYNSVATIELQDVNSVEITFT